jgi:hypothetical protein
MTCRIPGCSIGNTRSQRAADQNLGGGFGTAAAEPTTSRPRTDRTSVAADKRTTPNITVLLTS